MEVVEAGPGTGIAGNGDFMLVGSNVHPEAGRFSLHLEMTAQLFDVLTDESEVEHPLCEDCTDSLLDLMEDELTIAEAEVCSCGQDSSTDRHAWSIFFYFIFFV